MTDITTLTGYRADITTVFHGAALVPENLVVGQYAFASWVRNGLATAIAGAPTGLRATVPVSFDVTAEAAPGNPPGPDQTKTVSRTLTLRGPGDVIGIDETQVTRRSPPPNVALSDSTSLALIEFNRPDLPWIHSPIAAAGAQLKPWIALVVVDASVSTLEVGQSGLPDRLTTQLGELQPLDDAWAWAHAQVLGTIDGGPSVADRMGDGHAADNLSRLICPRQLSIETSYIAAVVPTYDAGVQAGLGLSGGTLGAAWSSGAADTTIVLPAYVSWRFTIGENWDFETLARRLEGVPAPWQVGRRGVDLRTPRGGITDDLTSPGGVQIMDCALHSPADLPAGSPPAAEWSDARTAQLQALVDVDHDDPDLPRVGPRLYARFQRGATAVPLSGAIGPASDWFTAINLRPLDRLVAGLGTRVVQRDQDKLMQAAWLQVGEVAKANAELDRIRLSRYVAAALIGKTLNKLPLAALTAVTHPVHGKIMADSGETVWSNIATSALPGAASMMAFRRTVTGGAAARTAVKGATLSARVGLASAIATTSALKDLRVAYADPAGLGPINAAIAATLPAALLGQLKAIPAPATPLADALAAPRASWTLAAGSTAVTSLQAAQFEALNVAMTSIATLSAGRAEALGAQYQALAVDAPSLATQIGTSLSAIDIRLGASIGTVRAPITVKPILTPKIAAVAPVAPAATLKATMVTGKATTTLTAGKVAVGTVATTTAATGATVATTTKTIDSTTLTALQGRFGGLGQIAGKTGVTTATAMTNATLADGLSAIATGIGIRQMPTTPASAAPTVTRGLLLDAVEPGMAAKKGIMGRLGSLPPWLPATWFDDLQVKPIMAAPRFDRAMWDALADYDQSWVVPNLGLIDQTDFVTLLFDNPRFSESYLIGLSDEMGRELLWRSYPTDQRGTYFYRMWSETGDDLDAQIARFSAGALGTHLTGGTDPRVVMLVKGQVIKRHPDAIFVAVQGTGTPPDVTFTAPPASGKGAILFHAPLAPDTLLVGFDLTESDVAGGDWWFLLAEHPSAPRFGLDTPTDGPHNPAAAGAPIKLDDLAWGDLPMTGIFLDAATAGASVNDPEGGTFAWGADSASVARILLQDPARAAFEAVPLLAGAK